MCARVGQTRLLKVESSRKGISVMKLAMVVSGLIGLSAVACGAAPAAPARVAQVKAAETSDATPATGRATTLAAAISAPAAESRDEAKADEPAPLPAECGAEGT